MHRIRTAFDAVCALAVWAGVVFLSLRLGWELALIVGGIGGLVAVFIAERR